MNLYFKTLKLYNFGSYHETELSLSDYGFCLVSGENKCEKDNAISNGSGKSTIWSAICYALTGETLSGLKTNLKNINIDEDLCYVTLELSVDNDDYIITRYQKPKNDLKIIKNSVDISGKGIRESEAVLEKALPNLTKDLIANTILLGQGLPQKFSSFSPSGRKELLEKLTQSDFMINDIKERIESRLLELNNLLTQQTNSILINNTNLQNIEKLYEETQTTLKTLDNDNIEADIKQFETQITSVENLISDSTEQIQKDEIQASEYSNLILQYTTDKAADYNALTEAYNNSIRQDLIDQATITVEIKALEQTIQQLDSIIDVCPTCGQKLPNVAKPDSSKQKQELKIKKDLIKQIVARLESAKQKNNKYSIEIEQAFSSKILEVQKKLQQVNDNKVVQQKQLALNNQQLLAYREKLASLLTLKNSIITRKTTLKVQLEQQEYAIHSLKNMLQLSQLAKAELDEHIVVVKKMETLTRRDFRGYLLTNIINYLDFTAKEYCKLVFGTESLHIYLNGNSLDISYDNKLFDSLSGGEKQKCDLILQFTIRDLLQNYLNYSSNILVIDEAFDALDKLSTDKIINLIITKLKDIESVFIISHHADELMIPVDSELKVIKNESGISEIV